MRVYFAPCGIGLGHVGRCIPIARKLLQRNAEVMFSTYREGIHYVKQQKLPFMRAPPIGFQVKPDGTIDFRQTAINPGPFLSSFTLMKQIDAEMRGIEHFRPDVVVSDSRISPLLAARILGVPRICILNQFQVIIPRKKRFLRLARFADSITLTIVGKMWTGGNITLIPDFPQPYTICAGNLNIPKPYRKNVRLIGPLLPVRPNELPTQEDLRKKLGLPTDRPVIFAPISGPIRERAFLTGILRKIFLDFPEDYEVVMSLGYPNADNNAVRHGNVTFYKWIPNRFEYLKTCDLVIGRAGHGTLTQCLCYGKPMILVPTPSHTEQISNAKQVADLGAAKILQQETLSREKLLKGVRQILESEIPERLEEIQKEVLKYDGLEKAVNTVIETAENKQVF
jgi:UDP-N-acetylglucosamine--N-acetylmuramyl-(pentapeptide) pyrophosphoryl-undecaprenol N-acetylglucosamine transferase